MKKTTTHINEWVTKRKKTPDFIKFMSLKLEPINNLNLRPIVAKKFHTKIIILIECFTCTALSLPVMEKRTLTTFIYKFSF